MEEELKEYGKFFMRESDSPDREPIDFSIEDGHDNVAWVWGSEPFHDIQVECNHPGEFVQFDDDEPVGWCDLCGASCDCHYELDTGNVEDYYWSGRRLVPHSWTMPDKPGGIIGKYIKKLQESW